MPAAFYGLSGRLQRARTMHTNLSCRRLSVLAGLAQAMVAMIERGEIRHPSSATCSKIANTLGISLDWLVDGVGGEPTVEAIRSAIELAEARERGRLESGIATDR